MPNTSDTLIREAFEKWVLSASTPEENLLERLPHSAQGDYRWQVVHTGWMAWRAAWDTASRCEIRVLTREEAARLCRIEIWKNTDGSYSYSHSGMLPFDDVFKCLAKQGWFPKRESASQTRLPYDGQPQSFTCFWHVKDWKI
jgi:hypothetical protein